MPAPRDTLLRAAALLRQATDDAAVLDVADYLAAGARGPIGDYLGAPPGWRRSTADRDHLIRSTASRLLGSTPIETQANLLHDGLAAYRDQTWQSTCLDTANPNEPGTLPHLYWAILRHRDHALSVRQFEKIISKRIL